MACLCSARLLGLNVPGLDDLRPLFKLALDEGAKLLLVEGEEPSGGLADPDLDRVVRRDAEAALAAGSTAVRRYGAQGQANEEAVTVFFESYAPPPRLLVFGAVDFTAALVRVAKVLGYHVTVCDAREVFATKARFPLADEVVVDWPHRHLAAVGGGRGARAPGWVGPPHP